MLSVVIPALDEEGTIGGVVSMVKALVPDSEVIVVDSGHDRTAERAQSAGALVISQPKMGYGAAIVRGIAESHGDYVAIVDSDGTYESEKLGELYREARKGYVAVGCRIRSQPTGMNAVHYIGNSFISIIYSIFYWQWIKDTQSGMKVFPRKVALRLHERGMTFSTEILTEARKMGIDTREVQIGYYKRADGAPSKLHPFRDGRRILKFMFWERLLR